MAKVASAGARSLFTHEHAARQDSGREPFASGSGLYKDLFRARPRALHAINGRTEPPIPPDPTPIRLTLGSEAAGQRLDRALADRLPEHSRTVLTQWIRAGRVLVDGEPLPAKHKVAGGEEVEIDVPPPRPTELVAEDRPLDVLHEDEWLLLLNKPVDWTVHPGSGRHTGTVANALVHRFRNLPVLGGSDRPGIVHRLDKDTSGVMVVAKTEQVQRALSDAFAQRTVEKSYLACVHGVFDEESTTVDLPIGRSPTHRTRMTIIEGGRESVTHVSVERRFTRHTLLHCRPRTGRTHQIRVHLRALHHPIVGDPFYGWKSAPGDGLPGRLMLHAWRLAFVHPGTGEKVSFEAPPPEDFVRGLEALEALPPRERGRP